MTNSIPIPDESQRKAAKVVGFCYLFAMATGILGETYVRGRLIDYENAALTAQNIMAHKTLFRLGIGAELLTFMSDIALITSLYIILAPVHRYLALLATFLRLVAEAVCVMMAAHSFDVLRILGSGDYLQAFEADQLAALARLSIGAHVSAFNVGFVFMGFGSMVFGYLWLKSNYVPKAWGYLGVFGSFLLMAGTFAILLVPSLAPKLGLIYMVPLFFFEVGMGLWLLLKGLRAAPIIEPARAGFRTT